jgi:protein-L-isoaspartate(D-aspartate) O-methyltransferase
MTSTAQPSISSSTNDQYAQAREAMVVCQLQPSGIITEAVMNAYRAVPRENFVPRHLGAACYIDETIDIGNGKYLLEPLIHGLLVEHANIMPHDKILVVGDATGYSAALLRELSSSVTDSPTINDIPLGQNFDVIIMNGAVANVPQKIADLLNENGRLTCVLRQNPKLVGRVIVITKMANNLVEHTVKDENAPYIKGCEPDVKFLF